MINNCIKNVVFLTVISSGIVAQVGGTLAFQGVLRDPTGTTVSDGYFDLTLNIYNSNTSTTILYTETLASVVVSGGVFSVELGAGNTDQWKALPFDETYYVGIQVDGGTEMSPRSKLTTSPYAMAVYGATNIVPNDGNVGFGTVTPTHGLHIISNSGTDILKLQNSSQETQIEVSEDGDMTIASNLILGDNDPDAGIVFPSGQKQVNPQELFSSRSAESPDNLVLAADQVLDGTTTGEDNTGDILMQTKGVTNAVITNNGNFGIGTTSPSSKLDVVGNTEVTGNTSIGGALTVTGKTTLADGSADNHAVNFDQIYPVGSIYMNASSNVNPGTLLGIGTWQALAPGRVLLGAGSNDGQTYTAGGTSGARTHTLTANQVPSHSHGLGSHIHSTGDGGGHSHTYTAPGSTPVDAGGDAQDETDVSTGGQNTNVGTSGVGNHNHGDTGSGGSGNTNSTGSNQTFNIMQPYLVVYMWKRTN